MIKLLITSGCSFSQVPNADISWPLPLSERLNVPAEFHGRAACGNGIISRTIINSVNKALKIYEPEEILVGIMWSGLDRLDFYRYTTKDVDYYKIKDETRYYCNPQWVTGSYEAKYRKYIITHPSFTDEFSKIIYKNFYSDEHGAMVGLEHILRTQWFLKLNKIKYFMTTYAGDALPDDSVQDTDIKNLLDQIDWDNWIEEKDMDSWARTTGLPYKLPDTSPKNPPHPSTEMHKKYVDEQIIPHLKKRNII